MRNHMESDESIIVMLVIMIIATLLTGMNLFVNKRSDIRLNINDFYMGTMMNGIMFILMGMYYKSIKLGMIGVVISVVIFICIRMQTFVKEREYLESMIPHHSMAILMTKKLEEKGEIKRRELRELMKNIINTQEKEIEIMKKLLNN